MRLSGRRIAILAGSGRLPIAIAESVVAQGGQVEIVAIGEAPQAAALPYPHMHVRWGAIGLLIRALTGNGSSGKRSDSPAEMVIAGGVKRPDLRDVRPDLGFFRALPTVLSLLRGGDDAVLTRAVRFFEAQGLTVRGVHEIAPELMIGHAALGSNDPRTTRGWLEAEPQLALAVLDALGDLDIGQAIVVDGTRVLGIEGAEGTDRLLDRVAALPHRAAQPETSGLLLKAPKPGQELRVDLPSIGPETVRRVGLAKLSGIAVARGLTIALDQQEMHDCAVATGLFVVGLDLDQRQRAMGRDRARMKADAAHGQVLLLALGLSKAQAADAYRAMTTVLRLQTFGTGQAAVAVGRHVLSVSAAEGPLAAIVRTRDVRQWGIEGLRRGAVALRFDARAMPDLDLLAQCVAATDDLGLAVVLAVGDWPPAARQAAENYASSHRVRLVFCGLSLFDAAPENHAEKP